MKRIRLNCFYNWGILIGSNIRVYPAYWGIDVMLFKRTIELLILRRKAWRKVKEAKKK